jgi:hypothetical protein
MQLLTVAPHLTSFLVALVDQAPKDEDVKAGWVAFAIFIGLILAVAFLGWSLVRQLRKAQAAEDAGLYDHDPTADDGPEEHDENNEHGDRPADHQS